MARAQHLVRRSRGAEASLWVVALTDAAAIPAGLAYASYLGSLNPTADVEQLELVTPELIYSVVGLGQLVAMVVAAVLFIRWFYLAYSNLADLSDQSATHAPKWTAWGFFVPILNLVRPQQLMRELWSTSCDRWQQEPSRVVGLTLPTDHVNLWWGLFLATSFIGNVIGRAFWDATTAQDTLRAAWATSFADAFDIGAAVVAVFLVRSVTQLQRPLLDHAPAGPSV